MGDHSLPLAPPSGKGAMAPPPPRDTRPLSNQDFRKVRAQLAVDASRSDTQLLCLQLLATPRSERRPAVPSGAFPVATVS
jgi:hypothetical protein